MAKKHHVPTTTTATTFDSAKPAADDPPVYLEADVTLRGRVAQVSSVAASEKDSRPVVSDPSFPSLVQRTQREIVVDYFTAIISKQDEVVAALIESGVVTTETTNFDGRTPLVAAIEAGNIRMVQRLLDLGADVNMFAVVDDRRGAQPSRFRSDHVGSIAVSRSPLMCAAEKGSLPMVKLLMETYKADDSLVASDGELALRLAAANDHGEVVDYLPSRRRGGFRRWKTKHQKAMKRCLKAGENICHFFFLLGFEVPKFFLWSIPKHVLVLPAVRGVKWMHAHRAELPGRLVKWMKLVGRRMVRLPKDAWYFSKELADFIWTGIKRLPKALKIALVWAYAGVEKVGTAMVNVCTRLFSFLHTALAAIASFFRNVTLKDVWNGFKVFLRALFVDGPKKMWEWLCEFEKMTLKMFEALWGCTGWLLWTLFRAIVGAIVYVPKKIVEILVSIGGSVGGAFSEVLIWIDPKRR
ncbi:hypothetical protein K504DRAFT_457419 [Pleomassaria siparia CBS 279.74]|uniref:Uncharacterized protein n=1 Tax=Pleomassaria siparia CBS 279.74 TaxID=1314801 RepID=A0A6G1KQX5_9PLEO|nr:hypothetical protein K504DRAFT_457419 [Pleomassaria siparia CBS 279.74]